MAVDNRNHALIGGVIIGIGYLLQGRKGFKAEKNHKLNKIGRPACDEDRDVQTIALEWEDYGDAMQIKEFLDEGRTELAVSRFRNLDTASREKILNHIDPKLWGAFGYNVEERNRQEYAKRAESFSQWSQDEMNEPSHKGRKMQFDNWLDDEIKSHGDIPLSEWGYEEEHDEPEHQHSETFRVDNSHADKSMRIWEMVQQNLNNPMAVEGFYATFFGEDKAYYDGMELEVIEAVKDLSKNPEWTDEMIKEYGLNNCSWCGKRGKKTKYLPSSTFGGGSDYWCEECYEDAEGEKWDAETFASDMEVGNTIYRQLGGNRFRMMTGAKDMVWDGDSNSLQMKIGRNSLGANYLIITLNNRDLYDMRFESRRWNRKTYDLNIKVKGEYNDLYADQLQEVFTEATGLYTRMAESFEASINEGRKCEVCGSQVHDCADYSCDDNLCEACCIKYNAESFAAEERKEKQCDRCNPEKYRIGHQPRLTDEDKKDRIEVQYFCPVGMHNWTEWELKKWDYNADELKSIPLYYKGKKMRAEQFGAEEWWEEYRDDLEAVDLGTLDWIEQRGFNRSQKHNIPKAKALQVLINNVELDDTQLSPQLAKIARMQVNHKNAETFNAEAEGGLLYSKNEMPAGKRHYVWSLESDEAGRYQVRIVGDDMTPAIPMKYFERAWEGTATNKRNPSMSFDEPKKGEYHPHMLDFRYPKYMRKSNDPLKKGLKHQISIDANEWDWERFSRENPKLLRKLQGKDGQFFYIFDNFDPSNYRYQNRRNRYRGA